MPELATADLPRAVPAPFPDLGDAARAALALARAEGGAILRVHAPTEPARVDAALTAEHTVFAWTDGRTGARVAAQGEAVALRDLDGASRFEEAQQRFADLAERVVDVAWTPGAAPDPSAPFAVGGFAFDPQAREAVGPWAEWSRGELVVPERLLVHAPENNDEATLIASVAVRPGDDVEGVLTRVEQALGGRAAAPDRPADPDAGVLETPASFRERVAEVSEAVAERLVRKVVLARAHAAESPAGFDAAATLNALRAAQPDSYCFSILGPGAARFIGASPETLVRLHGDRVSTQALAATTPRGGDAASDEALGRALVDDAKSRIEHAEVVDAIRAALAPVCGALEVADVPRLARLARVQHLETPITGRLRNGGNVLDLVARLHPTPAVGGTPTPEALRWLRAKEPMERGWYAGPVGWVARNGDGVFAVAIRSALLDGDRAWAFAGGGMVEDSDPDAEWRETELKLSTILGALRGRR